MASVNKVILIGNLGSDPTIKEFPNGSIFFNDTATTETWKDRDSGERKSITDWHNVVVRRTALANVVKQYVKKGMSLYIEGKIRTRSYEKEGEKRYVTEVLVDELTILTPRNSQEGGAPMQQSASGNQSMPPMPAMEGPEDDLPF